MIECYTHAPDTECRKMQYVRDNLINRQYSDVRNNSQPFVPHLKVKNTIAELTIYNGLIK